MTMSDNRLKVRPPPPQLNYAAQKLDELHANFAAGARVWALYEVGTAMAHQLNEHLNELLFYLNEMKNECHHSAATDAVPRSIQILDRAFHEMDSLRNIVEQSGYTVEATAQAEIALAQSREAVKFLVPHDVAKNGGGSAPDTHPNIHDLTPREQEVLSKIAGGASNKEGGYQLGISTRTFEVHRAHIMEKLGARNAADLVRIVLTKTK